MIYHHGISARYISTIYHHDISSWYVITIWGALGLILGALGLIFGGSGTIFWVFLKKRWFSSESTFFNVFLMFLGSEGSLFEAWGVFGAPFWRTWRLRRAKKGQDETRRGSICNFQTQIWIFKLTFGFSNSHATFSNWGTPKRAHVRRSADPLTST